MGGALPRVQPEKAIEEFLDDIPKILKNVLDLDAEPNWCVLINRQHTIAGGRESTPFSKITVAAELQETIPADANGSSDGTVRKPIFPIGLFGTAESIDRSETAGYREQITETLVETPGLEDVSLPNESHLDRLAETDDNRNLTDSIGNEWSELNTQLARASAERSLKSIRADSAVEAAISLDVCKRLLDLYQYDTVLTFRGDETDPEEYAVPFERIVECRSVEKDDVEVAEKVYVHENRRAGATDHDIEREQVRNQVRGGLCNYKSVTITSDPSDLVPVQYGRVVEADADHTAGFVRVAPDADVSMVYTFWAALRVPDAPYLTHEIVQQTSDWTRREEFPRWSATGDGFSLTSMDDRRGIYRSLEFNGYWVVEGRKYRNKSDFKSDLRKVESFVEEALGCSVSRFSFDGTKISRQPIHQRQIVDAWRDETTTTPDNQSIVEVVGSPWANSTEIDGVDRPLFVDDLDEFVVDTNLVDARVVSQLVVDGELYNSTVVVPDVVVEEVHRQTENGREIGSEGVDELVSLRELDDAGLLDLEIVRTSEKKRDNVAVDQKVIEIAQDRCVPICSEDETLLRLAEVFGVTTFQLEQESGQQGRLLKRILGQTGEVSEIELAKRVEAARQDTIPSPDDVTDHMFPRPDRQPRGNLEEEIQLGGMVDRLVAQDELYRVEDRVGLVRDVRVLPGYDVVAFGELSSMIRDQTIRSQLDGPLESWHIDIAVPQFVRQWSRVEGRQPVSSELDRLEGLCRQPTVNFDWCPPDLDHAEVLRVDEEYVRRAFENTSQVERHGYDQSVRVAIGQDGESVVRSVDDGPIASK